MDPALHELLRSDAGDGSDEIEAIIRLDRPHVDVAGVRIVARFGPVATCRLQRDRILTTWHDDNVLSLKRSRPLGPEVPAPKLAALPATGVDGDGDERRPPDLTVTGAGVVVGVVDWGCDVDHPNFKRADGTTRLLGLWDQRRVAAGDVSRASERWSAAARPYGYGTSWDRRQIDAALRTREPYDALGYHPAGADSNGRGAHGTHVLDIAAGNGRAGGPAGVAPGADLVFVHLAEQGGRGLANLGDSARILEAVDFIARVADGRPWVINLSVGRCGGPHDGSTLAELALDHLVRAAPGRFIVQSVGNYFERSTHASGRLVPRGARTLSFVTDAADRTPNELEIWYPGGDELAVMLESPTGRRTPWIAADGGCDVVEGGGVVGRLYHRDRDPNNGDNHIDVFLAAAAPAGTWHVSLGASRVVDGTFHAWLERDEACRPCQAHFVTSDVDRGATTGTIANGREPFVVGAYDGHDPARRLAGFSSAGPTRDGRRKPDCVAPGVQVLAARSAPPGATSSRGLLTRKSGTSMAAPHVTGAVALCFEAARRRLASDETRALLHTTLETPTRRRSNWTRLGGGYLDVRRLVAAATALADRASDRKEPAMPAVPEPSVPDVMRPDELYRQLVHRRHEPPPAWITTSYAVVARPGERPCVAPDRGDVLVRVALGERGLGHVAVLAGPALVPASALDASGVGAERDGPGYYGLVVERGPYAPDDRFGRRILDRHGCMPAGQLLLRPRRARLGETAAEEAPDVGQLIDGGASENEIANELFFSRNPTNPRQPVRAGTESARQWRAIRDRDVRPALKRRLAVQVVDPILLAMFLSQYEDDGRVPPRAKELFLTQPPLLSMGKTLRDRLLWNWHSGGAPVTVGRFYDLAFEICGHAGTAALLCHSVAKAFTRGGEAIHWQRVKGSNDYTDGRRTFTPTVVHPAGELTYRTPEGEVTSIFYLLFSAAELSRHDPGDWYHYFVTATMTAYGAAGELAVPEARAREAAEGGGERGVVAEVEKVVYPLLVTDRLLDLERQMSGPDASSASARRGWVYANALSFLEGGYYGDGQDEVARESAWHRRGAVFGMRRAGSSANPTWPWYVPIAGSISREELVEGFRIEPKTAAVLDPTGKPFVAGSNGDAEDTSSPCSRARAAAHADSPASTRLLELLAQPIAADDRAGIERRVRELTKLFTSLVPDQRSALRWRLDDPGDALGRFFDCELHHETRRRLRALLDGPAPTLPATPAPSPPSPPSPNHCRRREHGALTVLAPWERELLGIMNGVDAARFDGVRLFTGPVIHPLHDELQRLAVPVALAQPGIRAITIGEDVWFRDPLDTSDTDRRTSSRTGLALLVHESVHVVDYERMGIAAFLGTYFTSGLAVRFDHGKIPHEERANAVEESLYRVLERFPDLERHINACDGDAVLAFLRSRREEIRAALPEP